MHIKKWICAVAVLLLSLTVWAQNVSKKNVTINGQVTVANLIKEIENQTGFLLVYSEKAVDLSRSVNVRANDEPALSVIEKALAGTGIVPKVEGNTIVLSEIKNAGDEKHRIQGTILDANGDPVVGANILVKGTREGTFTDVDGHFEMNAPANAVLVCSSIGYETLEVPVGGRRQFNLTLAGDTKFLDDVIVIGYGTAKKRDYIGSVSTVKAEDIQRVVPTSMESALQGMATGVQVNSGVGVPGAPQQIKVRGVSSISSGTDPLWIIDGIPIESGTMDTSYDGETNQSILGMFNPGDIETIQILKDAAATAIYGSRGSNGVILVTTKSGQKGSLRVNVDVKGGISQWAHPNIGLVNTEEWMKIANTAMQNTYNVPFDVSTTYSQLPEIVDVASTAEAAKVNTDWVKEISRLGNFYETNVSLSQGTERFTSYTSLKYRKDNGNLKWNDLESFSANTKLNWKLTGWLDVSYRLAATYTRNNRIKSGDGTNGPGGWGQINTNALPWYAVYNAKGEYWNPKSTTNPLASLDPNNMRSFLETMNLISALTTTVRLPIEGLSLKGEWGVNFINSDGQSWRSARVISTSDQSIAKENRNTVLINNLSGYLNYDRTFGKIHEINAVAGVESMRRHGQYTSLTGTGLVGQFKEVGTPNKLTGSSGLGGEVYLLGYFARANYKLLDRYIINASARRDGISKFSAANRWANFYSLGLGWIISEEPWFNNETINLLKLRGSVGQTGNTNIPAGITTDKWEVVNDAGSTLEGLNTSRLLSIGNDNLKWETTTSYDAGIDFGLWNNRVNGSIAYYRQNVKDMLLAASLPTSAGIRGGNKGWMNIGDMYNHGVEFELFSTLIQNKDFTWSAGFNIATNANIVTALDPDSDANHTGILNTGNASQVRTIIKAGLPYGTYYMAEYAGVDAQKGIPIIYEVETKEDGTTVHTGNIIPGTSTNIEKNKMILTGKTALPKLVGGFNTRITWHGFDASAVFSFACGQYVYSRLIQSTMTPNAGMLVLNRKLLTDAWQNPGDVTDVPQINAACSYYYDDEGNPTTSPVLYGSENKTPTSRFLEKADYLKLRNLTLGYTFPLRNYKGIQNLRVYLSGGNLFTITPFSGYDPEVEIDQATGGAVETFLAMPSLRTFTCGVNFTF